MYMIVILTSVGIYLIYLALRYMLKIKLSYGIGGLFLILMPYSIGILRTLDSSTCIITLALSVIGIFLVVSNVVRFMKRVQTSN